MDDIQIVLYIIFVLFAILSRVLKKKKESPKNVASENTQSSGRTEQPKKQLTFEELLKEFTEAGQPVQQRFEEVEEEEFDVNNDEEIQRIYEESVKASKEYENSVKSGDDRHTGNFTHFKGYSEEDTQEEESEFAKLLQDEENAKNAIILSEIINRKY